MPNKPSKTHQCYVCEEVFALSDLRFECRQWYRPEKPHWQGVCKGCALNRHDEIKTKTRNLLTRLHDRDQANLRQLQLSIEEAKERHGFGRQEQDSGHYFRKNVLTLSMRHDLSSPLVDVAIMSLEEYKRLTQCTCCQSGNDVPNLEDVFE